MIAHGDYSSTANCWTKVPMVIVGYLEFYVSELLFIYSTIFHKTPKIFHGTLIGKHCPRT